MAVIQKKHIAHHGVFMRVDHPGTGAFGQHGMNFRFGHRVVAVVFHPQQAQQSMRGQGQQAHKRLGCNGQKIDRAGYQPRQGFWMALAQTFGHQLAHHDRKVGDHHHHQACCGVVGIGYVGAQCQQPEAQWLCQGGFTNNTVEHANGGDPDLDRGQETRGVFPQLDGRLGAAIALIHQFLQPGFARCHECNLGHGKQAIDQDKDEK